MADVNSESQPQPQPPSEGDAYFAPARSGRPKSIFPGVTLRAVCGEQMMLSVVDLEPGSIVQEHSHPHEQLGYLVSGVVDFTVGGVTRRLKAGDRWVIPGGVPHKVVTIEGPAVAIDIFHPIREDYREGG
ncbi:MAG: cupin domain-containing protein [Isosphaeraceae bacterium]